MLKRFLFLTPDPVDGGTPPAPDPSGPPPPVAKEIVGNPGAKESDAGEIVRLKQKLDEESTARKKVETRAAELEDENRRLKTPPPPKEKTLEKKSWMDGFGLLS